MSLFLHFLRLLQIECRGVKSYVLKITFYRKLVLGRYKHNILWHYVENFITCVNSALALRNIHDETTCMLDYKSPCVFGMSTLHDHPANIKKLGWRRIFVNNFGAKLDFTGLVKRVFGWLHAIQYSSAETAAGLLASRLFDHNDFYPAFVRDLGNCTKEIIIESPFITRKRMAHLLPTLRRLRARGVKVVINTRHPHEHDDFYMAQAFKAIAQLQSLGILVLYTGGHHRKLAVLDRAIVWEGSLNILSQSNSCEIMRKITSRTLAEQMIQFLRLDEYLNRNWHERF